MGKFHRAGRRTPNGGPASTSPPEEAERLIATAQKRIGARTPHRDATMILVAYRHGLRANEFCALRWAMLSNEGRSNEIVLSCMNEIYKLLFPTLPCFPSRHRLPTSERLVAVRRF
jgi:hypothetical protein